MSLSGKAKKAQIQEQREKERQRAAEEQAKEKAHAARAEREREQRAREALQGGPAAASATLAAATPAASARPAAAPAAAAAAAPRAAVAAPPPLLDDDDEFGGIIPVRRIIRGGTAAAPAPAATATAGAAPSVAASASSSSSSGAASAAASLPSVVPMLGSSSAAPTANKLRTAFARESDEAIAARKAASRLPLVRRPELFDAAGTGGTASTDYYSAAAQISIPLRPDWHGKTPVQVETQEQDYFHRWLEEIYTRFPAERLNHFEHNLEVWRQLWRVCERSDILLVIVDARMPLLNFPPSLYRFITGTLRKPLVMVLNKIDLIPSGIVHEWLRFFASKYPSMHVVPFTSFPGERQESMDALVKSKAKRGKGRTLLKPYGAEQLLDACRKIVASQTVAVPDAVKQSFSFEPTLLQGGSQSVEKNEQIYAGADDYMRAGASGSGDDDDDLGSSSLSQELAQLGVLKNAKRDRALKRKQLAEINARHLSDLKSHPIAEEQEAEAEAEIDEDDAADAQDVAANSAKYSGALGLLEDDDQASSKHGSFITLGCLGMPNAGQCSRRRDSHRARSESLFAGALTRGPLFGLCLLHRCRQILSDQRFSWS